MYYLQLLFLFLPAFIANACPVLLPKIPALRSWTTPIHERLLGSHKTWRGFLLSPLVAAAAGCLQYAVLQWIPDGSRFLLFPYTADDALLMGFLLGLGALAGDAFKSFIKRRIGIAPGKPWPVFDGIDYILGALLFLSPFYVPAIPGMILLIALGPLASLAANAVSYSLGWKTVWY